MLTLTLLYIAAGILLILLAIPLYLKKIKPNPWYGFRTPKTMSNPELWYLVNKFGAIWMMVSGAVTVLFSIIFSPIPGLSLDVYAISCALVFAVTLTMGLIVTFRYLNVVESRLER